MAVSSENGGQTMIVAEVGAGIAAVPDVILVRKTFGADEHRFVSLAAVVDFLRRHGDPEMAGGYHDAALILEEAYGDA